MTQMNITTLIKSKSTIDYLKWLHVNNKLWYYLFVGETV